MKQPKKAVASQYQQVLRKALDELEIRYNSQRYPVLVGPIGPRMSVRRESRESL